MSFGTTIQIFLPDGNPRSIRLAEITNRTIQAILIPRAKLSEAGKRGELQRCSVYFLIGSSDEDSKPLIYVGEAEDAFNRLKQHNKSKDFWTTTIAIVSKTQHLTKTHIKYLEWLCYIEAQSTGRYSLENSNIPSRPYVSEPMEADLRDNFETIKLLVSTLGHPIFDKIAKPTKKKLIYCVGKDASAKGEYTEDGLVVFSGSKCNLKEAKSAKIYVRKIRQKLIDDRVLQQLDNTYFFTSDYIFSSPSQAAAVVLAREANGWIEWKYDDGKTLNEVHRQTENDT
ncbi:MAG: GIY-YIG nuclease family protein [Chloroflexi bacterium]|nr:GIY-YIG nuclease family protein [Chloroflexota bacterium]MBK6711562.1 GIY-YIG nuclease family protein [Chloroflexota bacterium]MBK7177224.1 GIY-YIG nuclease family protein [Chloroflexota bacterium]MBK8931386.1 GIY-YIG nuclease family protein [Chloroflexota bacterium]